MRKTVWYLLGATVLAGTLMAGCGGGGGPDLLAGQAEIAGQDVEPAVAQAGPDGMVRVIIELHSSAGNADRAMVSNAGGQTRHLFRYVNGMSADLPEQAIEVLRRSPRVVSVEPAPIMHASEQVMPWGVNRIDDRIAEGDSQAPAGNRGAGVLVAIIDSGIDYEHPDLDDNYDPRGTNYVRPNKTPMDDNGHGTHCAGIVAAEDNDLGVVGVAPDANVCAYKVLDRFGRGSTDDLIAAIEQCIDDGVDVVSMSMGSGAGTSLLDDACDRAQSAGLVLVAAAGNTGTASADGDTIQYPAKYDSVIAVGATDWGNVRPDWSSTGPALELCAPGNNIISTYLVGRGDPPSYATLSGTSMACPHVSGVAALAISAGTTDPIRSLLTSTADDLGVGGRDVEYGYGMVDADEVAGPVADLTDIAVTAVDAPASVVEGESVTVSITVENAGNQDVSSDITVDLSESPDDATFTPQTVTGGLAAGASTTLQYYWDTNGASITNHTLTASHSVVDDNPGNNAASTTINVTEPSQGSGGMYVWDTAWTTKGPHLAITVTVRVDSDGDGVAETADDPVSGASVSMALTGPVSSTFDGTTDSAGQVEFMLKRAPSGAYTAEVTSISDTYIWNTDLDADNPDTYTLP